MKKNRWTTNPCGEIPLGKPVKCYMSRKKRGRKKMTEVFFYDPEAKQYIMGVDPGLEAGLVKFNGSYMIIGTVV